MAKQDDPPLVDFTGVDHNDAAEGPSPTLDPGQHKPAGGAAWDEKNVELVHRIGSGPRGQVWVVQNRDDLVTGDPASAPAFCAKVIRKSRVVDEELDRLCRQRDLCAGLGTARHPNIVGYYGTCQGTAHVYLFFEYLQGGELFTHYRESRGQSAGLYAGTMPPAHVAFYTAQVVMALEHLHKHKVVYRDLRPETLLLDAQGHLRLADLGCAKMLSVPTRSVVGQAAYQAPEMFRHDVGYGTAVDWWSLGVVVYEMITGYLPFFDESPVRVREIVMAGDVDFPDEFDIRARDLVSSLLVVEPTRRLGGMRRGVGDVKKHKFYSGIDWNALASGKIEPPIKPKVDSATDARYFDEFPFDEADDDTALPEGLQQLFAGF